VVLPELIHSTNRSIGIQVCEAGNRNNKSFSLKTNALEPEQYLGSATNMRNMFEGAAAFNQPLSFNTAEVENVSAYL